MKFSSPKNLQPHPVSKLLKKLQSGLQKMKLRYRQTLKELPTIAHARKSIHELAMRLRIGKRVLKGCFKSVQHQFLTHFKMLNQAETIPLKVMKQAKMMKMAQENQEKVMPSIHLKKQSWNLIKKCLTKMKNMDPHNKRVH